MKIRTTYVCEKCGMEYSTKQEAEECEKQHSVPMKIVESQYTKACNPNDGKSHFPDRVYIEFEGGGRVRYRID